MANKIGTPNFAFYLLLNNRATIIMKYKHLFFDLDHTLWDFDANAKITLTEMYTYFNLLFTGASQEVHDTFTGGSQDLHRSFTRLSRDLHRTTHSY